MENLRRSANDINPAPETIRRIAAHLTAEPRRLARAIDLALTPNAISPDDDSGERWTVWGRSEYPYTVNISLPSCTCEDAARGRVLRCKHILAVTLLVRAAAIEASAPAPAPEPAPKRKGVKLRGLVVKRAPGGESLEEITKNLQWRNYATALALGLIP